MVLGDDEGGSLIAVMTFQPRGFSLVEIGRAGRDLPIFENLSMNFKTDWRGKPPPCDGFEAGNEWDSLKRFDQFETLKQFLPLIRRGKLQAGPSFAPLRP
jgi:hypothetical protein